MRGRIGGGTLPKQSRGAPWCAAASAAPRLPLAILELLERPIVSRRVETEQVCQLVLQVDENCRCNKQTRGDKISNPGTH